MTTALSKAMANRERLVKTMALSRDECWIDHEPEATCPVCGLEVDEHGNTGDDFRYCCYPDCGCDGSAKRADLLTISEVRKLSTYDAGWKGEGSFGPTPEALSDAEKFARSLFREADVKRPHVGLESSGEINLFWNMGDAVIDLGITGDGTYSYFAEIRGEKHYGDELPIGQSLPADILAKITAAA